jgi:hypothetical protein
MKRERGHIASLQIRSLKMFGLANSRNKPNRCQVWQCTPAIPALMRLRQEDYKFQDSLAEEEKESRSRLKWTIYLG